MLELTSAQQRALEDGLATIHNGRVIPIIRGGSGAEPEPAEPTEPAAVDHAPEPAPEPAPAAPEWSPSQDDWAALQDELAHLRAAQTAAPQPQPGLDPNFDLVEWLGDPLSEGWAIRNAQLAQAQMSDLVTPIRDAIQPLVDAHQTAQREAQQAEQDARVVGPMIAADAATHGDLTDEQFAIVETLTNAYTPQFGQRYGEGSDRALGAAFQQALQQVRAITAATRQAGAQEQLDQLHQASTQAPTPQPGGEGVQVPVVRIGQRVVDRVA